MCGTSPMLVTWKVMQTLVKIMGEKTRLAQLDPMEIVQRYTIGFHEVMAMLNTLPPSIEPTATGHIIEQIEMTQAIIKNGLAYEKDGTIYFDVEKFVKENNYGALSGRTLDDQLDNTRYLDGQEEKKGRLDFALWKKQNRNISCVGIHLGEKASRVGTSNVLQ